MTSPNSAFAEIRDNESKYFVQSIGILIFTSILGGLMLIPFVMSPFFVEYFADIDAVYSPLSESGVILVIGYGILGGIVTAGLLYFIGKKLGGNDSWKKVFSVIFYTNVPAIPFSIAIFILLFLMMDSFAELDPSFFQTLNRDEILSTFGPVLGYVGIISIVAIAFFVWIFIIVIKAVKTLNGFGTGKAFGLIILVSFIMQIIMMPLHSF